jgi:hypothetical protein
MRQWASAQGPQRLRRVGDTRREGGSVVGRDPPGERHVEDRDRAVGGQGGRGLGHPALAQRLGGRLGHRGELQQLALLQAGVVRDDRRPAYGVVAPVLEQAARRVVRLALDGAAAGSRVHAVGEEGLASRDIAGAIGDYLGVPTRSVAPDEVESHFGWIGRFFGMDITASSARTRELLAWTPIGPTLFEDIAGGAYASR